MNVGDRVVVVGDDMLDGWTGTVTKVWAEGGEVTVDLDPEQDPEITLTDLLFEPQELELI